MNKELIIGNCIILLLFTRVKFRKLHKVITYWSIEIFGEEDGDDDLIVMTDEALTGSNEVACWLRRLDLEHDGDIASVNEAKACCGAIPLTRLENQMTDGVYCYKLTPVFGRRTLGLVRRLHRQILSLK